MPSGGVTPMHVLLVPFGSAGDVYPFLALGTELKRRGYRVTMITCSYFEDLVRRAGFGFESFASREDYLELLGDPDLWHSYRSVRLLATRAVVPAIPIVHRLIAQHSVAGETAVVAGSLALGARVACEALGLPLTTIHLQPIALRSRDAPPRYPGLGGLRWVPPVLWSCLFALIDARLDRLYGPSLNAFRATLGLAPVRSVLGRWWHAPDSVLGLFPAWFAPVQADWPPQLRLTGFPLYDGGTLEAGPVDLAAWLAAGDAPVVFTSGSAMATGAGFFAASAAACARLGRRALFVTRFCDQLPQPLPAHVHHVPYAPFAALLPHAAAFVHHGGIGTAAQALAAGVPQLISPCAHDQFDNAARLERLGVGITLPRRRYSSGRATAALRILLDEAQHRAAAAALAAAFATADPLAAAGDALEAYWRSCGTAASA